ncbi:hypothetical protein K501DRAFT_334637 [Backusella circina FSU 941]|nr:hypothetical protein K501DRAFT_334637 [Backusella circina FSU 941]
MLKQNNFLIWKWWLRERLSWRAMNESQTISQESYSVDLERAEYILSLGDKKLGGSSKSVLLHLRELVEHVEARQKHDAVYYQAVEVVKKQYTGKIHLQKQAINQMLAEINYIDMDVARLQTQRAALEEELAENEQELNGTRDYAEQRRDKKSKRERQYHKLYHVPLVAAQFKKKYIRARDKNADAEEKVSEVREMVDACQEAIAEVAKTMVESHKKVETLKADSQNLEVQISESENLMQELEQATHFWKNFDNHHCPKTLDSANTLIELILQKPKGSGSLAVVLDFHNTWIKEFKMACLDYGEGEIYAEKRWGQIAVEFTCSKCQVSQVGWPTPDKVRSYDLLCRQCYVDHRSSMIWEKKVNRFSEKLGFERNQQLLSLPGDSASSLSTISTTLSTSSNKSGFKKMFNNMVKTKRSSSSSSFTLNSQDQKVLIS